MKKSTGMSRSTGSFSYGPCRDGCSYSWPQPCYSGRNAAGHDATRVRVLVHPRGPGGLTTGVYTLRWRQSSDMESRTRDASRAAPGSDATTLSASEALFTLAWGRYDTVKDRGSVFVVQTLLPPLCWLQFWLFLPCF